MTKELTPAQYEKMVAEGKVRSAKANYVKTALIVAAAIVLSGVSFAAGAGYQKGHAKSTVAANSRFGAQNGAAGAGQRGFGNRQRPNVGSVTAVAADSITITNDQSGASQTFKVSSDTTITNNGATAAISDIKAGDTVFIQPSANDNTTASRIVVNPAMGQGL